MAASAKRKAASSVGAVGHTVAIGRQIRAVRLAAGETLATLARKTGISASTLSKIENDKVSPTYSNLVRLAAGLGMQLNDLIAPHGGATPAGARLAVTRRKDIAFARTPSYELGPLCADLLNKRMNPLFNRIHPPAAGDAEPRDRMVRHEGEEFVFVLDGAVEIQTEHYRPLRLDKGDSAYFDSRMAHCMASVGPEPAEVLVVWLSPLPQPSEAGVAYVARLLGGAEEDRDRD